MRYEIAAGADIGSNCEIGPGVIIHGGVVLGDNSRIGPYTILGNPPASAGPRAKLEIGAGATVRSHCVIYAGSTYGADLRVGHHTMIREGVQAGRDLQVGSFNDLEGDVTIGDHVRFHSNVHIGRGAHIGNLVWLFPYVVLTNDPIPPSGLKEGVTVGDGAVVCTSSVVLPGTVLGRGAFVGATSRVRGNIPPAAVVVGLESRVLGPLTMLRHKPTGKAHPWMQHHADAYPAEAQPMIAALYAQLLQDLEDWGHS